MQSSVQHRQSWMRDISIPATCWWLIAAKHIGKECYNCLGAVQGRCWASSGSDATSTREMYSCRGRYVATLQPDVGINRTPPSCVMAQEQEQVCCILCVSSLTCYVCTTAVLLLGAFGTTSVVLTPLTAVNKGQSIIGQSIRTGQSMASMASVSCELLAVLTNAEIAIYI